MGRNSGKGSPEWEQVSPGRARPLPAAVAGARTPPRGVPSQAHPTRSSALILGLRPCSPILTSWGKTEHSASQAKEKQKHPLLCPKTSPIHMKNKLQQKTPGFAVTPNTPPGHGLHSLVTSVQVWL